MLDPAMPGEVEDRVLAEGRVVEVASVDEELVAFGLRFRDDLAIRRRR